MIFLHLLLLFRDIQTKKINKCCPLGKLLSSSGTSCVPMMSGTALPKVRVIDPDGVSDLVSFKWLKDQKMLREGARPRCEAHADIVPDFYEVAGARLGGYTRDLPYFSHDGVFVHEMKYYRPSAYCVDGVEDREAMDSRGGGQASYIMLLTCEEGGHDMRACSDLGPAKAASCHTRCCQPWQIYHHHSGSCVYTKSKYLERYSRSHSPAQPEVFLETGLPSCALSHSDTFALAEAGGVAVGGRRVEPPNYCISGHLLWYCTAAVNSSQLIVIEEEELEEVSIDTDSVSTSSSSVKFYQSHISHFYCLIFLLLVFHKCEHLLF